MSEDLPYMLLVVFGNLGPLLVVPDIPKKVCSITPPVKIAFDRVGQGRTIKAHRNGINSRVTAIVLT